MDLRFAPWVIRNLNGSFSKDRRGVAYARYLRQERIAEQFGRES